MTALGQRWATDRGFHIAETSHHSLVLIDGVGQGYFGSRGEFLEFVDTSDAYAFVGDAKYAYDYRWTFPSRLGNEENRGFNWEPESSNPANTYRALENPVQRAFRSLVLARGQNPYVLIVDDIQKDNSQHLYEWLLQTPDVVVQKRSSGNEMILGLTNAGPTDPELLVRVLDFEGAPKLTFQTYDIRRSPNTGSAESFGQGKRLVVSTRAVAPQFKILLYPYRPGSSLPVTTWQSEGEDLVIEGLGHRDEFHFESQADGKTDIRFTRDGAVVLATD